MTATQSNVDVVASSSLIKQKLFTLVFLPLSQTKRQGAESPEEFLLQLSTLVHTEQSLHSGLIPELMDDGG